MSHYTLERQGVSAWESIHIALLAFPIACFTLTVLTDLAYWATENLLWLHFSEWLLLAGLVASGIELLIRLIEWIARKRRPTWLAVIGAVVVMLLAIWNSFVHTIDGWQAVVPTGLTLSIVTVIAMIITAWLGRRRVRDV